MVGNYTLKEAIQDEIIYVLYHEETNNMRSKQHPNSTIEQYKLTSPITLFVPNPDGDLKVVAIQSDFKPNSPVYSPATSSSVEWTTAKATVNLVDTNACQAVWHLSHVHLSSHVYCTVFRSHLSERHPCIKSCGTTVKVQYRI